MVSYSVRNFYSKIRLEEIKKIEKMLYIPTFSLSFNTTFSFDSTIYIYIFTLYCLPTSFKKSVIHQWLLNAVKIKTLIITTNVVITRISIS